MPTHTILALALALAALALPATGFAQARASRGGFAASIQSSKEAEADQGEAVEGASQGASRDGWDEFADELDARERDIRAELAELRLPEAQRVRYLARLDLDELGFCEGFERVDVLGSTHFISTSVPTFETLWAASRPRKHGTRPRFVSELVTLVEHCEYSRGALYRAAFMLEYMYWNRMLDRVGMEVAQALRYRDHFYGLKFIDIAREKMASALGQDHPPLRSEGDFLDAPRMGLDPLLRIVGNVTTSFPPRRRRAFMAMVDILNVRRGSKLMFGNDLIALLDRPAELEIISRFYEFLLELEERPELGGPHAGWNKLMELTGGDRERGLRVITLMASLRDWVLEELSDALLTKDRLTPRRLRAFYSGANVYFMLHRFDELFAHDGKRPLHADLSLLLPARLRDPRLEGLPLVRQRAPGVPPGPAGHGSAQRQGLDPPARPGLRGAHAQPGHPHQARHGRGAPRPRDHRGVGGHRAQHPGRRLRLGHLRALSVAAILAHLVVARAVGREQLSLDRLRGSSAPRALGSPPGPTPPPP